MQEKTTDVRRAWLPEQLARLGWDQESVARLRYVVVDELFDGDVGLTATAWPWADGCGRLRFDLGSEVEVALTLTELRRTFYDQHLERAPRTGDVFAVVLAPGTAPVGDHADWRGAACDIVIEAYDISAEARKVSKLAYYARVAAVIEPDDAARLGHLALADTSSEEAPIRFLFRQPSSDGAC